MKKGAYTLIAGLLLAVAGMLELPSLLNRYTIVPSNFDGTVVPYSDSANNGGSSVRLDSTTAAGMFLSYELSRLYDYYYAGVELRFKDLEAVDLSRYSHVELTIDGGRSHEVRFFLLCQEEGYSTLESSTSWRHLRQVVPLQLGEQSYLMDLSLFNTPHWWYEVYNASEPLLKRSPLRTVLGVKVESGEGEPVGVQQQIKLRKVSFVKPVANGVRIVQGLLIAIASVLFAFRFGFMSRILLGKYKPVVLGNLFDEEVEQVTTYIGEHYPNSDLALIDVAESVAMHPDKVAALIKQGYGQTFKQYLNRLRLTEAKRLLRTTDRPVSEIAYAVGYNSVSHFNRVFKQFFACTPREFR